MRHLSITTNQWKLHLIYHKHYSRLQYTHPQFQYYSTFKSQHNQSISKTVSTTDEISNHEKDFIRKHNATKIYKSRFPKQKALFPWRHSSEALDRSTSDDNENSFRHHYSKMSPFARYGIRIWLSYYFFQVPLWKSISSTIPFILESSTSQSSLWLSSKLSFLRWDHDLTQMFSWAFGKAVFSMIHNTYHVDPIENEKDDGSIQIQFDYQSKPNKNEKTLLEYDAEAMIHSNLQNLYTCAASSSPSSYPPYQIRLETNPLFARIDGMHVIPGVTREYTNAKPNLVGSLEHIFMKYQFNERADFRHYIQELNELFYEASGTSEYVDFTIVMNVSILCDELFQVRDLESGDVIQGQISDSLKAQNVIHEVQFEKVFRLYPQTKQLHMHQSWQITDWDNLLNGNIWY